MRASTCCMAFALAVLSACGESAPPAAPIRLVRTVVVQKHVVGESVVLTGHIRAQDEVSLAFRIDGKLTERLVNDGDPDAGYGRTPARAAAEGHHHARAIRSGAAAAADRAVTDGVGRGTAAHRRGPAQLHRTVCGYAWRDHRQGRGAGRSDTRRADDRAGRPRGR